MQQNVVTNHDFKNSLHTIFLLAGMLLLLMLLGWLLGGRTGILWAVILGGVSLIFGQRISPQMVLRMYKAQPLGAQQAPELYAVVRELAQHAQLPTVPPLYYIPSSLLNAFAVGTRSNAAIALTDGILRNLTLRELTGVLAHEMSHIRNNDMRAMGLADVISRITGFFSSIGKFLLLVNLPLILFGSSTISWWAVLLLIVAPFFSGLMQLALSRTREFDADLDAVQLTHDPVGLANALRKLEQHSTNLWRQILLPGDRIPDPSILRTHPHTADRVARLLEVAGMDPQQAEQLIEPSVATLQWPFTQSSITRRPSWHLMGIWY